MNILKVSNSYENETLMYNETEKLNVTMKNFTKFTMDIFDFEDLTIWDDPYMKYTFISLHTIVFCLCFFGNLTVILVVTLHWRMRSITNFCLANLAVADLCVAVFCVFQHLYSHMSFTWELGIATCKIYHFINEMSLTASILILVVISIERYMAIIHPMKCKYWLTLNRLRLAIATVWGISGIYSIPRLYYTTVITSGYVLENGELELICTPNRQLYNSNLFDAIHMGLLFLLPLIVISVFYSIIGVALWKSSRGQVSVGARSGSESSSSSDGTGNDISQATIEFTGEEIPKIKQKLTPSCCEIICCSTSVCSNRGAKADNHKTSKSSNKEIQNRDEIELTLHRASTYQGQKLISESQHRKLHGKTSLAETCASDSQSKIEYQSSLPRKNTRIPSCKFKTKFTKFIINEQSIQNHKGSRKTNVMKRNERENKDSVKEKRSFKAKVLQSKKFHQNEDEPNSSKLLVNEAKSSRGIRKTICPFYSPSKNDIQRKNAGTEENIPENIQRNTKDKIFSSSEFLENDKDTTQEIKESSSSEDLRKGRKEKGRKIENANIISSKSFEQKERALFSPRTTSNSVDPENINEVLCQNPSTSTKSSSPCLVRNAMKICSKNANTEEILRKSPNNPHKVRRLQISQPRTNFGNKAFEARRKIIKMLVVIVLTFAICNLPFHARKIWQNWGSSYNVTSQFSQIFTQITTIIRYANSGINPILYGFLSEKFRQSLSDLFACRLKRSFKNTRTFSVRSTNVIPISVGS